ncbi:hypothetical protein ACO0RG_003696 [Hanseniaspora osmophila]
MITSPTLPPLQQHMNNSGAMPGMSMENTNGTYNKNGIKSNDPSNFTNSRDFLSTPMTSPTSSVMPNTVTTNNKHNHSQDNSTLDHHIVDHNHSDSSSTHAHDHELHIHSSPKKRVSKACYRCRQSKTRCININGGVCERCINENELCIYSKPPNPSTTSHSNKKSLKETYQQGKIKKLYNQEYINLLENKVAIYELFTKQIFNNFNNLIGSNVLQMHKENIVHAKLNEHNSETRSLEHDHDKKIDESLEIWNKLFENKDYFCSNEIIKTTNNVLTQHPTNVNINQLIYLILPQNMDLAVKSINYIADEHRDANLIFNTKTTSNLNLDHLNDGYVNKHNFFQNDLHKPVIEQPNKPQSSNKPQRKRRRTTIHSLPHPNIGSGSTSSINNSGLGPLNGGSSITLPFLANPNSGTMSTRSITPTNNDDPTTSPHVKFTNGGTVLQPLNTHFIHSSNSSSSNGMIPPHQQLSSPHTYMSLPHLQPGPLFAQQQQFQLSKNQPKLNSLSSSISYTPSSSFPNILDSKMHLSSNNTSSYGSSNSLHFGNILGPNNNHMGSMPLLPSTMTPSASTSNLLNNGLLNSAGAMSSTSNGFPTANTNTLMKKSEDSNSVSPSSGNTPNLLPKMVFPLSNNTTQSGSTDTTTNPPPLANGLQSN